VMHQGELLAVVGANGSGKSTTCHVLCGITPATTGDALVDDKLSLLGNVGKVVGWCPQHDILFDELTPLEHVTSLPPGNPFAPFYFLHLLCLIWFVRLSDEMVLMGRLGCMLPSGELVRKKRESQEKKD